MDKATKIYLDEVNERLDEYRKDEWHSMIPLSEEGGVIADDLVDFAIPKPEEGYPEKADYVLLINLILLIPFSLFIHIVIHFLVSSDKMRIVQNCEDQFIFVNEM